MAIAWWRLLDWLIDCLNIWAVDWLIDHLEAWKFNLKSKQNLVPVLFFLLRLLVELIRMRFLQEFPIFWCQSFRGQIIIDWKIENIKIIYPLCARPIGNSEKPSMTIWSLDYFATHLEGKHILIVENRSYFKSLTVKTDFFRKNRPYFDLVFATSGAPRPC